MRLPVEKPVTIGTRVKIGKGALSVPRASIAVHGVLDGRAAAGDWFFPNARRSSGSNAYLGRQREAFTSASGRPRPAEGCTGARDVRSLSRGIHLWAAMSLRPEIPKAG